MCNVFVCSVTALFTYRLVSFSFSLCLTMTGIRTVTICKTYIYIDYSEFEVWSIVIQVSLLLCIRNVFFYEIKLTMFLYR